MFSFHVAARTPLCHSHTPLQVPCKSDSLWPGWAQTPAHCTHCWDSFFKCKNVIWISIKSYLLPSLSLTSYATFQLWNPVGRRKKPYAQGLKILQEPPVLRLNCTWNCIWPVLFLFSKGRAECLVSKSQVIKARHTHPKVQIFIGYLYGHGAILTNGSDRLSEFWKYGPKCRRHLYKFIWNSESTQSPGAAAQLLTHYHKPLSTAAIPKLILFHRGTNTSHSC